MIPQIFEAFDACEATNSRKQKEEILQAVAAQAGILPILQHTILLAADPYTTFGVTVRKLPEPGGNAYDFSGAYNAFHNMAAQLSTRSLTGNAAKDAINQFFSCVHDDRARYWFKQILNRKLPKGVGSSTIKKVFGALLPSFDVQLASPWDGEFKTQLAIEPKLDGLRCLILLDPSDPKALSRNGKPLENMDGVINNLLGAGFENYVIDGEIYAGSWEASMSAAKKEGSDVQKALWAFDAMPLTDFKSGYCDTPWLARKQALHEGLVQQSGLEADRVIWTPHKWVNSAEEITLGMQRFVQQGFEGGILKEREAPYHATRNSAWQKVKPVETGDYKIVDVQEGQGRLHGTMGRIVVDVNGVQVGVGTGFSDKQRSVIWANAAAFIGKTAQIAYQNQTPDGSLRFPVFECVREDK